MKKIKGSLDSVKIKYLLIVFSAAMLLALPLRIYQLVAIVDTNTGFFIEKDATVYALFGLTVIFTALFLGLSYVSREVPSPKLPTGQNALLGVTSAIMTASLAWDIISVIRAIVPSGGLPMASFMQAFQTQLSAKGGFLLILQMLFAFLAAIYFIVFAISHINGKGSYKEFKFLAITPLLWAVVRIVIRLMHAISYLRVSELLIEIFMLVFLMLFLLTFARISSGVYTEDSMWGIYGYGLSAALLLGLASVPRLVMMIVGKEPVTGSEFNPSDLASLIFVLSYIFASLGIGFKDGIKNRKTVTEVTLPSDEDVVIKRDNASVSGGFAIESEEKEAVTEDEPAAVVTEIPQTSEEPEVSAEAEEERSVWEDEPTDETINEEPEIKEKKLSRKERKLFKKSGDTAEEDETEAETETAEAVSLAQLMNEKKKEDK